MRAEAGADMALMNSGGIRGNREYPAGQLTRRDLIQMAPFNNVVCTVAVTGRELLAALNHGVAKLPGVGGQFPQVSGMRFRVRLSEPVGSRVHDLTIGGAPVDLAQTYTLALPDFVLHGGDDYDMFGQARVIVGPEAAPLIVSALEKAVAGKAISPEADGRILIEP
jgi:5'-nucleotidase/UDP-sugar diphosphatase